MKQKYLHLKYDHQNSSHNQRVQQAKIGLGNNVFRDVHIGAPQHDAVQEPQHQSPGHRHRLGNAGEQQRRGVGRLDLGPRLRLLVGRGAWCAGAGSAGGAGGGARLAGVVGAVTDRLDKPPHVPHDQVYGEKADSKLGRVADVEVEPLLARHPLDPQSHHRQHEGGGRCCSMYASGPCRCGFGVSHRVRRVGRAPGQVACSSMGFQKLVVCWLDNVCRGCVVKLRTWSVKLFQVGRYSLLHTTGDLKRTGLGGTVLGLS